MFTVEDALFQRMVMAAWHAEKHPRINWPPNLPIVFANGLLIDLPLVISTPCPLSSSLRTSSELKISHLELLRSAPVTLQAFITEVIFADGNQH